MLVRQICGNVKLLSVTLHVARSPGRPVGGRLVVIRVRIERTRVRVSSLGEARQHAGVADLVGDPDVRRLAGEDAGAAAHLRGLLAVNVLVEAHARRPAAARSGSSPVLYWTAFPPWSRNVSASADGCRSRWRRSTARHRARRWSPSVALQPPVRPARSAPMYMTSSGCIGSSSRDVVVAHLKRRSVIGDVRPVRVAPGSRSRRCRSQPASCRRTRSATPDRTTLLEWYFSTAPPNVSV